jgi:hypothetical protein
MSAQQALENGSLGGIEVRAILSAGAWLYEHSIDHLAGAVFGAALGTLLLALAVYALPSAAGQQYQAERVFSSLHEDARFDLRGDWMDEQLARAFGETLLRDDAIWQEYRVIPFPQGGAQLVCAPDGGPIATGFIFPGRDGLKTVMPWDRQIVFEILLLCSVRI